MKVAETQTLRASVRVFDTLFTLEMAQREESVIPEQCGEARVVELQAFCVLLNVSVSMLVRRG